MPKFEPNTTHETDGPVVKVEVDASAPLRPGTHTFQLVVKDDDGLESDPDVVRIVVEDDRKPTAVLEGPSSARVGESFELRGHRSTDPPPGKIVKYFWTRLD